MVKWNEIIGNRRLWWQWISRNIFSLSRYYFIDGYSRTEASKYDNNNRRFSATDSWFHTDASTMIAEPANPKWKKTPEGDKSIMPIWRPITKIRAYHHRIRQLWFYQQRHTRRIFLPINWWKRKSRICFPRSIRNKVKKNPYAMCPRHTLLFTFCSPTFAVSNAHCELHSTESSEDHSYAKLNKSHDDEYVWPNFGGAFPCGSEFV